VETISCPVKSRNNWRITVSCSNAGVVALPYLISYNNIGVTRALVRFSRTTDFKLYAMAGLNRKIKTGNNR